MLPQEQRKHNAIQEQRKFTMLYKSNASSQCYTQEQSKFTVLYKSNANSQRYTAVLLNYGYCWTTAETHVVSLCDRFRYNLLYHTPANCSFRLPTSSVCVTWATASLEGWKDRKIVCVCVCVCVCSRASSSKTFIINNSCDAVMIISSQASGKYLVSQLPIVSLN
jgi:hypothetical protein